MDEKVAVIKTIGAEAVLVRLWDETVVEKDLDSAHQTADLKNLRLDDMVSVYLAQMTQEPLLTFDEEVALASEAGRDKTRHCKKCSGPGIDSEAVMLALKEVVAISNGSACTSQHYEPSHVLQAMGLDDDTVRGALRISWCHLTTNPDWDDVASRIRKLK